ncbi:hypothetical protein HQ584_11615 [Patescibacteria group bacterium]|nr:hypothetical protein [Patescibacteria group bacterium]
MANALLYVVGNSDVKINSHQRFGDFLNTTRLVLGILKRGKEREIADEGYKLSGKDKIQISLEIKGAKQNYNEDLTTIELPIFIPIMKWVMRDCHKKPDKIYLFGTKQKTRRSQDTIYTAQIIGLFVNEKYKIPFENIIVEKIEELPFDYDQMADYFIRFFEQNQDLKKNVINYISLTAGIPAETTNIALGSMDLSVKYLYLPRGSKESKEVKLLSLIYRQKYASIIQELIKNYQYGSALDIALESPYGSNFQLLTLLEAMRRRILFDFYGALKECRKMHIVDQAIRNLMNNLADLSQMNGQKILEELIYRVELSFKKKDYLEGIALLFSLTDNFLQYQFKASTGKKIEKINEEFRELNQFISEKSYIKDKEKYLNNPSRPNLRELLSLVSKNELPIEGIEKINSFINRLERPENVGGKKISILDLRNRGPYAHGNMGVTEELIKKIYPPYGADGIINDLNNSLKTFFTSLTTNPFDVINDILLRWLEVKMYDK